MKRQIKTIIVLVIILLAMLFLLNWCSSKPKITAWYYLDKITEIRQEKQQLLNNIEELDKQIIEYRTKMDSLQYSWIEYLGLIEETDSQTKSQ